MEMTIEEHIGVIEDLKSTMTVCMSEPEKTEICTSLSVAIDALRKHQKIKDIYQMEQKQRWIPASERLPDTDDNVLCWYEYYHWSQKKVLPEYGLGRYFRETSAWFGEVANGKDVRVIAWMPLPKPYKAESEEK